MPLLLKCKYMRVTSIRPSPQSSQNELRGRPLRCTIEPQWVDVVGSGRGFYPTSLDRLDHRPTNRRSRWTRRRASATTSTRSRLAEHNPHRRRVMRNVGWTRATWHAAAALAVLLSASQRLHAQDGAIAGTAVVSGSQRALPGVQISVSGQAGRGAVTDASGRFRITGVTGSQVVLQARMLGYRPDSQTVRVGATDVRFVMTERALELERGGRHRNGGRRAETRARYVGLLGRRLRRHRARRRCRASTRCSTDAHRASSCFPARDRSAPARRSAFAASAASRCRAIRSSTSTAFASTIRRARASPCRRSARASSRA